MKKFLTTIFVVIIALSCIACAPESRPTQYKSVNLATIGQEVDTNLARATEKYVGGNYSFYAELSYVSQNATTITAYEINPAYELGVCVSGKILDQEDKDIIKNANDGDVILIKGKITDIDLGFMISAKLKMDIYEIRIQ